MRRKLRERIGPVCARTNRFVPAQKCNVAGYVFVWNDAGAVIYRCALHPAAIQ
jgi:hypothetical protein